MLSSYAGKVAVISGAAEGIGRALALEFARCGVDVAVLDVDAEAAAAVVGRARELGRKAQAFACDVSLRRDVEDAAALVARELGPPAIVWANAGVGAMGGVLSMDRANLDWAYEVNVVGVLNILRTFGGPLLKGAGPRHIGLTASVSGLTAIGGYAAAYGATKYAVVGIGEALRAELAGTGIGVTICCPGLVNTGIWNAAKARPERFGGRRLLPQDLGVRWREQGMSAEWVARAALEALDAGACYVSPVDGHSLADFDIRMKEIRQSFKVRPEASEP